MESYEHLLKRATARLLKMHYESRTGHIGSNLSCLGILLYLHHRILTEGDQFILSKGHAAGALYVTLWSMGLLEDKDLKTFQSQGTKLSGHPPPRWRKEVPFATGSLGHGLSLAAGLALAQKLSQGRGRVYCLVSDGELNEGSTWEALHFIGHHKLPLTLIVDNNQIQGLGPTREIINMGSMTNRLEDLGWLCRDINGHEQDELQKALANNNDQNSQVIIAHTKKGFGISFMENSVDWHYLSLTEELYEKALAEVNRQ